MTFLRQLGAMFRYGLAMVCPCLPLHLGYYMARIRFAMVCHMCKPYLLGITIGVRCPGHNYHGCFAGGTHTAEDKESETFKWLGQKSTAVIQIRTWLEVAVSQYLLSSIYQ